MIIKELIQQYEVLGVHLWTENGKLKFKAEKGILTEERKNELVKYKTEIINCLSKREQISVVHDAKCQFEPFSLTDIQAAYLVGRKSVYDYGGVGCHAYVELVMDAMDKERLEKAWHKVIMRHPMLRAIVNTDGTQQVLKEVTMPQIEGYDLFTKSKSERNEHILKIRKFYSNKIYDPQQWPLYDLVLTNLGDKSILHFSIDMLIADFVSNNIVLNELSHFYYYPEQPLQEVKYSFRDIMEYKENLKKSLAFSIKRDSDKKYWKDKLSSFTGGPELPLLPEKNNDTVEFEQYNYMMSEEERKEIDIISGKLHITPSVIILMAYTEVLRCWSKRKEFYLNLTMLNRPNICEQIDSIVGDFTNVEVLQIHENNNKNYVEKAKAIQEQLWKDIDHNAYSGIEFLRELSRKKGENIIIPVVYTSTIGVGTGQKELMKNAKIEYKISQTPQVWIDCQVLEQGNNILVNWDVRKGVFPDGVMKDLFDAFTKLLSYLATGLKVWEKEEVALIPTTQKERHCALNNTKKSISLKNLQNGFFEAINCHPDKIALVADGHSYTYEEMAGYVSGIQKKLAGIKGKNIAILFQKGVLQVAATLAVLSTGNTYLPINCSQPVDRIRAILKNADTKKVLTDGKHIALVPKEYENTAICVSKDIKADVKPINVKTDINNPAYIIFTSGSTGTPKGVVISHAAAMNTILDINDKFKVNCQDVFFGLANYSFDLSVYDLFAAFEVCATLVLPDEEDFKKPEAWIRLIEEYRVSIWNSVPAQMQMLYESMKVNHILNPSLRIALLSGDWIPVSLAQSILKDYPQINLFSLGGATECSIWSIFYPIKQISKEQRSIPYGQPLANQRFYVLDSERKECPDYVTGKLYIAGNGLAMEYINSPELTTEKFIYHKELNERLYDTGDLGRYIADGNIEILGREDNQIKIHGHRIEIGEIEGALACNSAVQSIAVVKSMRNKYDIKLTAFLQLALNNDKRYYDSKNEKIIERCNTNIEACTKNIDKQLLNKWVKLADKAALTDIMFTFQKVNVFKKKGDTFTKQEVIDKLSVLPKYDHLLARWFDALCKDGFLTQDSKSLLYTNQTDVITNQNVENLMSEWEEVENKIEYGKTLFEYLKKSSGLLPELLKGDTDPLDLFFPKGNLEVAASAYRDNLVNKNLNKIIEMGVAGYIKEKSPIYKVKILEVGAGVGGTSAGIIPALKGLNVEYHFTDISTFFLNEAKKQFEQYDWVKFGLFDINKEYWEQGHISAEWDIIICANVLHNSQNAVDVLRRLNEIGKPGGLLMMIEATGENHALLTSMEFKEGLTGFTDSRKNSNRVFFNQNQWTEMLLESKIDLIYTYPRDNDILNNVGQAVYISRIRADQKLTSREEITNFLKKKVPEYMVPNDIELLCEIPLTSNGKIDKRYLEKRLQKKASTNIELSLPPESEMEIAIANIWTEILNKDHINKNDNFFNIGGDSLLIAQAVAKIQKTIPQAGDAKWDSLMLEMLKNPTVESLARVLENDIKSKQKSDKKIDSPLTILVNGSDKNSNIQVLFPGGIGTLTQFNNLLSYLANAPNRKGTICGFWINDFDKFLSKPSKTLIKELGAEYADLLLSFHAESYELIGYCFGGLVAIETAKNMMIAGANLKPVLTIDTLPNEALLESDILMEKAFSQFIGADEGKTGYTFNEEKLKRALTIVAEKNHGVISTEGVLALKNNKDFDDIVDTMNKLLKIPAVERLDNLVLTVKEVNGKVSADELKKYDKLYAVFRHISKGVWEYEPDYFAGDLSVLSCIDKSSSFLPDIKESSEVFLEKIALGEMTVQYIPGNHASCIVAPHVEKIAEIVMEN